MGIRDRRIGRIRQINREALGTLKHRRIIIQDRDSDGLFRLARRKTQRVSVSRKVRARRRGAVGQRIYDSRGKRCHSGPRHREVQGPCPFVHGHVIHGKGRAIVIGPTRPGPVVNDRPNALGIGNRCVRRIRQINRKALGALKHRRVVIQDRDSDGLFRLARRKAQRVSVGRKVRSRR